jgi:glycosyltransferase involved in cell wall biosynthesis
MHGDSSRTFRVALFHPALVHGGIPRVFLNLASGFLEQGLAVDLVQATPDGGLREYVPSGARPVDLNATRALTSAVPFARYLRRERPDAVISGAIQTNLVAAWIKRRTGLPPSLILTEHNMISLVTKNARTLRARMTPALVRMFYGWADGVIAVSRGVASDLASIMRVPKERIRMIYNPVIGPEFRMRAAEPLIDDAFLSDPRPVVLAVGRLEFEKDYPTLLRAFAELRRGIDARLVFLGEGDERAALQNLADSLGLGDSVTFKGNVANPLPYMKHATVLALSSIFEALPTVLIEGLAMGVPIVATDAPTGPAEILCNGVYGTLVPVGDSSALARALSGVIEAGYRRETHEDALDRFQFEQAIASYLHVLGLHHVSSYSPSSPNEAGGVG